MGTIHDPPKLGPFGKTTPTRADGLANSDAAPWIEAPTEVEAIRRAAERDTLEQILVELRVVSRVLAIGLNVSLDDVEVMRADENASVGV